MSDHGQQPSAFTASFTRKMTCSNCFSEVSGHYCSNCSQKVGDAKYTIKGMVSDLFLSALHIEKKGLVHTARELTLRPGAAIRKVIDGQRLFLYPPFKYLVLMGAIVILLSIRYKFFHNEYTKADNSEGIINNYLNPEHLVYLESFFKFAEEKATMLNVATIPIFALMSWSLLFFRRFNFAETLIINTFITAHQLFLLLLMVPIIELLPMYKTEIILAYSTGSFLYNVWVYFQLSEGISRLRGLVQSLLVVAIAFAYQMPVNLLIYLLYNEFLVKQLHWTPHSMMEAVTRLVG